MSNLKESKTCETFGTKNQELVIGLVKIHGVPLALHQSLALVVVFMVAARCDERVVMVTRGVLSTRGATYSVGKT